MLGGVLLPVVWTAALLFPISALAQPGSPRVTQALPPVEHDPCSHNHATNSHGSADRVPHLRLVTHCGQALPIPTLAATPQSSAQVSLTWTVSGSTTGVDHYEVWRSAGCRPWMRKEL